MPAGDFTATKEHKVRMAFDRIWGEQKLYPQLNRSCETLLCLLDKQQIALPEGFVDKVMEPSCEGVDLTFLCMPCDLTPQDCGVEEYECGKCPEPVATKELGTDSVPVKSNFCFKDAYKISPDVCKNKGLTPEQQFIYVLAMLNAGAVQYLQTLVLANVNLNLDNLDGVQDIIEVGQVSEGCLGYSDFNGDMIAEICSLDKTLFEMNSPCIIDAGCNFYINRIKAAAKGDKDCGDCYSSLLNKFEYCEGNKQTIALAPKTSYIVDAGSMAFISRNRNSLTQSQALTQQNLNAKIELINAGNKGQIKWKAPVVCRGENGVARQVTYNTANGPVGVFMDICWSGQCFDGSSNICQVLEGRVEGSFLSCAPFCDDRRGVLKLVNTK